jgi:dCMP deaminase
MLKIPPGERHELCRGLHAEQNAIIQAAYHGVSINGAHLYCTHLPCSICIKMLINAGIREVYYENGYPDELSLSLIEESSIVLKRIKRVKTKDPSARRTPPEPKAGTKRKTTSRNT